MDYSSIKYCQQHIAAKITFYQTHYTTDFYALSGSTFSVSFPSLSGSDGTYALVELREINGSVLESQSVTPSNDSQSVTFMLEISGLVELHIINTGLSGAFDYDIMIREISPPLLVRARVFMKIMQG